MKKSLKRRLERLFLLPYYSIWLYQNKRIQRLQTVKKEAERWVAIADHQHGLAEEKVEHYKKLTVLYEDQVKNYKAWIAHQTLSIETRDKLIEDLTKLCKLNGIDL